ncbi:MAG: PhzF family phenazine biosynthesis protein [Acidimicrobiia bacterium]|nr:PhzF family phenazine biosynthesis protein [Acidimicrobiia bacterium]
MRAVLLDVFTDRRFTGNQLAVFPDGGSVPEGLRQDIAREIGFSETVFVDPPSHPTAGDARIRIFTPAVELPFAGHPVLGTAVALGVERSLPGGSVVTLECGVGPVPVELSADGTGGWMRQPIPTHEPVGDVDGLLAALGLPEAVLVAPVEVYDNGPRHIVVAVQDPAIVAALDVDHGRLLAVTGRDDTSVCAATGGEGWTTRVFAPGAGIPEDPATGSAAGPVGVHLLRHGLVDPGREIVLSQGVEMLRPSILRVRVDGLPDAIGGVGVGGSAVIVGELTFRR